MASEYTTIIKLDPFFQRFLRAQFPQEGDSEAFCFPLRHDFNQLLSFLVRPCPLDYRIPDYGEWTFRVGLPNMEHKNVRVYNYLSDTGQVIFSNRVRRYVYMIFHSELTDAVRSNHLTRMEAIDYLMDEFGFTADDYDRLLKEYQRWVNTERVRRHRSNTKVRNHKEKESV